jgi:hypothetical protein
LDRLVEDAQGREAAAAQLIHSHSRLMEMAQSTNDPYAEHLNRGIGLYLLAQQRAALADFHGDLPASGLLWKAIDELDQARRLRPGEARPCWYLHQAWRALSQQQPAQRWLRAARDKAAFSFLTPAEQRGLFLTVSGRAEPF